MAASQVDEERVLIAHGLTAGTSASLKSFTLPDPRNGRPQAYLLGPQGGLLELNRFKQQHSAWLTGDKLVPDGGVYLATPLDPLLVLLPVLDRARDKDASCPAGRFKALDEILYDQSVPGLAELMTYCRTSAAAGEPEAPPAAAAAAGDSAALEPTPQKQGGQQLGEAAEGPAAGMCGSGAGAVQLPVATLSALHRQVACVCDVRQVDDETCFYRLNDQRVLAWLRCKFRGAQAALAHQLAGMDPEAANAYVLGMLSEYVGEPWLSTLSTQLGISAKAAAAQADPAPADAPRPALHATGNHGGAAAAAGHPPPEKKQKLGHDPKAAAQQRAQEAKQAAMAKQAAGTKKISAFFGAKAK